MLSALRLRDFVIVDRAEIEFGEGFNVLSGETGAGKSILVDALLLALGGRADAASVRQGAARADIVAEFRIDAGTQGWLAERDLAGDDELALLRRVVDADGRSRAFVNGHPATAALLRELGERLVDIHGQHANQSLLRPDAQRALLDAVAGLHAPAAETAARHRDWSALVRQLDESERRSRELALERERLEWQAGELAAIKPVPGEWEQLNAEHTRLSHAAALIDGARAAADAASEADESAAGALGAIEQRLRALVQHDAQLAPMVDLLESARIQVEEAGSSLARYAGRVDLDPARLDEVDRRLAALHTAARKLRLAPDALAAELDALQARLADLAAAQDIDALRAREAAARQRYDEAAQRLSQARRAAAGPLQAQVTAHMQGLGMGGGRFEVAFESQPPAASGIDRVEFRVSGHAGSAPRSLARTASGGELSRVSLAIAVIAAQANPVPTLIFDEADAGVGGATAELIGQLMRSLGDTRQVLCVTHLAQVAALAHVHFRVTKDTVPGGGGGSGAPGRGRASQAGDADQAGVQTVSRIARLDRVQRVEEVARMLGGVEITQTTRRHAREMLDAA